jgi:iron complex transport system ATP-binding protein
MNSKLQISKLKIGYVSKKHTTVVYENISADFREGMMVGIIGKNGLGKSTLLRTMAGLQDKLGGEILIDGKNSGSVSKPDLAKAIAVVLTEKVGGFNLTVTDLVSMGRVPYTNAFNQLNEGDEKIINDCISICGLNEHKLKSVSELSDGLFQKAMIAKGLAQQTTVLLLDEPTAYLDFPSKHQLFELLKKISVEDKKCIITSSHDIELILKYSSHLLIMSENNEFEFIETSRYKSSALFKKVTNNYFDE